MKSLAIWLIAFLAPALSAAEGVELLLPVNGKTARLQLEILGEGENSLGVKWERFLDELFDYFDCEHDGLLNESEVKRIFPLPGSIQADFGKMTASKKGSVSKAEFRTFYRNAGFTPVVVRINPPTQSQLQVSEVLFRRFDKNQDGVLSKAELSLAAELFKRLDVDEDDALTREEILAGSNLREEVKSEAAAVRANPLADPPSSVTRFQFHLPDGESKANWKVTTQSEFKAEVTGETVRFSLGDLTGTCDFSRNDFDAQLAATREFYFASFKTAIGKKPFLAVSQIEDDPALKAVSVMLPFADRDGDGKLTTAEVEAFLSLIDCGARCQLTVSISDPGHDLFALLDTNHDGKIDRREGSQADTQLRGKCETVRRNEISRHVAITLEPGPTRPAFGPIQFASPKRVNPLASPKKPTGPAWFRAMDRNQDGLVSKEEFLGSPEKFAQWDTNGDGLLSAAESEAVALSPAKP